MRARFCLIALLTVPVLAAPAEASFCNWGACYSHAVIAAPAQPYGAQVRLTVERPGLGPSGVHSLAELSIGTDDRSHVVEVGWTVDPRLNGGSTEPHLFVFAWSSGAPTCYNACGFVRASSGVYPGMPLDVGSTVRLRIAHVDRRWAVSFNGVEFGSYPDALWSGPWPSRLLAQAFGEVAYSAPGPVEMGDGQGQSRLLLRILEADHPRCFTPTSTDPRYLAASTGRCAMSYGGT